MANGAFDLKTASAIETADAVRTGACSAREACEAAIERIEKLDGPIHAVVVRDFDRARVAAKQIDASRTRDDKRPLLGVPMTVKESNDVAGLPTTWGVQGFKDLAVHEDSVAVARLKAAGAVILGKTNVPVALADWQAVNPVYGRTVNPFDHSRTPGGSSGGAAAALATHMIPLEFGSDIGGSIRVPAHMCGVFGHKPTYGIVPLKGHGFPGTDGADVDLAVVGPLARTARDLSVALDAVAGPMPDSGWRLDLPAARQASLRDYRVLVLDTHPSVTTASNVREPLNAIGSALEKAGVSVLRQANGVPDLAAAHQDYGAMLTAITTRGVPGVKPIDAHAWMELTDKQMRLARQWRDVFADVDVVLTPCFGVPAFPHDDNPDWGQRTLVIDGETTRYGAQVAWPGVATFPGLPATAIPIAKTREGLPVGAQAIGPMFGDRTTLAFAQALQEAGLTI
ncbi:MAG: amidase [Alphaproteobacteria bacterium]|nr:amidase [Alphaproteobacteria bacterium]